MSWPLGDPLAVARRTLSQGENVLVDQALAALAETAGDVTTAALNDAGRGIASLRRAGALAALLARLPRHLANKVADAFRDPFARPITPGEVRLVAEAHGTRVPTGPVRIVRGVGLSPLVEIAYLNGNPAITFGNTIYVKSTYDVPHADLSATPKGAELIVHEFTHVVQYATLGFAVFGARYAAEMAAHGGNADELYDYKHRELDYRNETLEGQAQMAGNFGGLRHPTTPQAAMKAARLRQKLRGSGVYGQ